MRFVVRNRWDAVDKGGKEAVALLRRNSWDDYHFKTLFEVELQLLGGKRVDLGSVKILKLGQKSGPTELPGTPFSRLEDDYGSLGQDIEYYEKLVQVPKDVREDFLRGMQDAVADPAIVKRFESEVGWNTSLLRFGQATHALSAGPGVLTGQRRSEGVASFDFIRDGLSSLTVPFRFDDDGHLPGRCNVIIGYNGVGKTHLLAGIANAASKVGDESLSRITGQDSTFAAVIAVSYSAFDTFEIPNARSRVGGSKSGQADDANTEFFGYTYCGLRRTDPKAAQGDERLREELKGPQEIDDEFVVALKVACEREGGLQALTEALATLGREPSFGRIGIEPSRWAADMELASTQVRRLSTGHKVVSNIVVQLAAHLRQRSLVLLDEPETHLHPPLLAALLQAVQRLLDHYDSFAVIATHSPVVLQEIPAANVHVLFRFGDRTQVEEPNIETFGENVGEITRHVFSLDSSATDYQGVLKRLSKEMGLDEIEGLFSRGLSSQARALVLRANREDA